MHVWKQLQWKTAHIRPYSEWTSPEVTNSREFPISGLIGESGQKMSSTNLMQWTEDTLDWDVIEAFIEAISPGLKLSDVPEIKTDLTLSKLKTILKEGDPSDQYQRLRSISQEPEELNKWEMGLHKNLLFKTLGKYHFKRVLFHWYNEYTSTYVYIL